MVKKTESTLSWTKMEASAMHMRSHGKKAGTIQGTAAMAWSMVIVNDCEVGFQ